ncbi:ABC transporter permease [Actinocorallia longicatena]|uniref:ABC transporter permease n=1 Tax=Actinocorallia longicatena TaxID=111803 RepID=A0ABP6QLC6_9ACTN
MYLVRRAARFAISAVLVVLASFAMLHLIPGDPVRAAMGPTAPADAVAARRAELGLDRPVLDQLWTYLGKVATGDFGVSALTRQPAGEMVADRLPATLQLVLPAIVVAFAVAVPLGMWTAARTEHGRSPRTELAFSSVTGILTVLPEFLLAVFMIWLFSNRLGWLPPAERSGPSSFVMPVAAMAAGPIALLARYVRLEAVRELSSDYIRLARAKRLPVHRIHLRHLLPNTLTAALTSGGTVLSSLLAGSVVIENVFRWPGLGGAMVDAIVNKDYALAQASILVYGIIALTVVFAVDLLLVALDPRSTLRETG